MKNQEVCRVSLGKRQICILSHETKIDNRDNHVILELVGTVPPSTDLMRE